MRLLKFRSDLNEIFFLTSSAVSSYRGAGPYKSFIVGIMTVLFLFVITLTVIEWYKTSVIFCGLGVSRATIFINSAVGPCFHPGIHATVSFLNSLGFLLADSLMVLYHSILICQAGLTRSTQTGLEMLPCMRPISCTVFTSDDLTIDSSWWVCLP